MSSETPRRKLDLTNAGTLLGILVIVLPAIGTIGYPWFKGFLSTAVAAEVTTQVQTQVAPISAAMRVILESQVVALEDEIASMEFRRDNNRTAWTEVDAHELLVKQRRLFAQRSALVAMEQAARKSSD